jgi:outer membrane receptor protein involved in Fe transport
MQTIDLRIDFTATQFDFSRSGFGETFEVESRSIGAALEWSGELLPGLLASVATQFENWRQKGHGVTSLPFPVPNSRSQDEGYVSVRGGIEYLVSIVAPELPTRFRASVGAGYRAPNLTELFETSSGPFLDNESGLGIDLGIDHPLFGKRGEIHLSAFDHRLEDEINRTVSGLPGTKNSLGSLRAHGLELAGWIDWDDVLRLEASYTYTETKEDSDLVSTTFRPIVPRHAWSLGASVDPTPDITLSVTLRGTADMRALDFNTPLPDFVILDASLSYRLADHWAIVLRGDNLLNEEDSFLNQSLETGTTALLLLRATY